MYLSKVKEVYYLYYTHPRTGKITRITTKCKTLPEAEKFKINFTIPKIQPVGMVKTVQKMRLEELEEKIINHLRVNNYTTGVIDIYRRVFNNLKKQIGNKRIDQITPEDLENYKSIRFTYISPATLNIEIRVIKAFFNIAVNLSLINSTPAKNLKQVLVNQKDKKTINPDELERLLSFINNPVFKSFVLFAYYSGCRLSEISHLEWEDVNFNEKSVIIRNKATFKTKSGRNRVIPLSSKLLLILSSLSHSNSLVFPNKFGGLLNKNNIGRDFRKARDKAGINKTVHFHCLRHSFITRLVKNGVNVYHIKTLAGHQSLETTLGYTHLGIEDLRSAVNSL